MQINKAKKLANDITKRFIKDLGLNEESYVYNDSLIKYHRSNIPGMSLTPGSTKLSNLLRKANISNNEKEKAEDKGLILISSDLMNDIPELLISIIHEQFHLNRTIITNGYFYNDDNDEYPAYYKDGHFIKKDYDKEFIGDASQEILRASIDTSQKAKDEILESSSEELEMLENESSYQVDEVLIKQQSVDEALVELMAITAYMNYNSDMSIIESIKKISESRFDKDIIAMARIILRHGDLELFKWMLDPLYYQANDINYDFLNNYLIPEDENDILVAEDIDYDVIAASIFKR